VYSLPVGIEPNEDLVDETIVAHKRLRIAGTPRLFQATRGSDNTNKGDVRD